MISVEILTVMLMPPIFKI